MEYFTETDLERFREHLLLLARNRLSRGLQATLDPSGLVQDTFLEAWKSRESFRGTGEAALRAWLRKILSSKVSNAVRDNRRRKRGGGRTVSLDGLALDSALVAPGGFVSPGPSPSSVAHARDAAARVDAHLARLPAAQRKAVVLRYRQGLSIAEIASRLGKTEGAVSLLIHRGLGSLRGCLRPPGPGADRGS